MIIGLPREQDFGKKILDDKGNSYNVYLPSKHLDDSEQRAYIGRILSGGITYGLLTDDGIKRMVEHAHEKYAPIIKQHSDKTLILEEGILNDDEVTHRGLIVFINYNPSAQESSIVVPGRYGHFFTKDGEIAVKFMDNRKDTFIKKLGAEYKGMLQIWPERAKSMHQLLEEVAAREARLLQAVG